MRIKNGEMKNMSDKAAEFLQAAQTPTVPPMKYEEYKEVYKDAFEITRKDGICEIRMHSNGGSSFFGAAHHNGWPQVLRCVGKDPENEVVIITGTGDEFVKEIPREVIDLLKNTVGRDRAAEARNQYKLFVEGVALVKNLINEIEVPTIGVVNGPAGAMSALATLCDITICSDTATFEEAHFACDLVPADGTWQAYAGIIGVKRAAYLGYTHQVVDAQTALQWGLVNEVVPKKDVNARAWELAADIMKQNEYTRRITHAIVKEYYGDMVKNMSMQFAAEAWAYALKTLTEK